MIYFTTLSLIEDIPSSSLEEYASNISNKYIFVKEYGHTGENPHYHLLIETDKFSRTDKMTDNIKKKLYANHPDIKSPKLVMTKLRDNFKKASKYLFKEEHNQKICSLVYQGIDEQWLKKELFQQNLQGLIASKYRITVNQLPYFIAKQAPVKKVFKILDTKQIIYNLIEKGYIIPQLREAQFTSITFHLNALLGNSFKDHLETNEYYVQM